MTITEKFKDDSARAAIRALRGLEQTAIMLETWAPEVFPETTEVNGVVQKHFGRVMMESAAESIRQAWADAIKEVADSDRTNTEDERVRAILAGTAIGSLPNDYPLSKLALETWNKLQERTLEGLALIGRIEEILIIADAGSRRIETAMDACDKITVLCYAALPAAVTSKMVQS